MFEVVNALLSLAKGKKTDWYDDSTAKTKKKNEEKSILVSIQNMKKYCSWFERQSGVVVVQENLPNEQG